MPDAQSKRWLADFTVWSPEESFVVREDEILHRHKVTPYLDAGLTGVAKATWVRGNIVSEQP